ncbi:hypothetical protein FRX31_015194 [Thalictrum thalictroides]|uniref:RING-type domain-containing protein n=1 Tax=Thalictrum thalictroides TaxID=46969 RepID=A0A7J6WCW7_THATH|nr:hypothetical protein FRX31_015194 [Thalictrum thalictroides]
MNNTAPDIPAWMLRGSNSNVETEATTTFTLRRHQSSSTSTQTVSTITETLTTDGIVTVPPPWMFGPSDAETDTTWRRHSAFREFPKKEKMTKEQKEKLLGPRVFIDLDSEDVCAICIEDMEGDEVRTIGCNHTFHNKCISKWVEEKATCPSCRFNMSSSLFWKIFNFI